uniref:t-SNARE coiled-coil homology domain-containing protein n=1 Tax=Steinernema glaseri TaxID=37863 RepID=A0A1I7YN75_9BILA
MTQCLQRGGAEQQQSGVAQPYNPFEDVELGGVTAQQQVSTTTARGHVAQTSVHSTDQFLDEVNQLHLMMDRLDMQIQKLKMKQTTILEQVVVQPKEKDELENLIATIKLKTNELRPHLKNLELEIRNDEAGATSDYLSGAEIRIRREQCNHLKKKLRIMIDMFNDTQIEYKQRVSKRVKRQLDLAGEQLTEAEVKEMLDSKSSEVFYRQVNPLSVAGRIALEDATARHQEIIELERNIAQLNEMFVDVYELVHSQGEMVDRINTNVEAARDYTGDANVRIKKALMHKKSAHRKKIYCIILVICVLLILIAVAIVLGVTLSGGSRSQ